MRAPRRRPSRCHGTGPSISEQGVPMGVSSSFQDVSSVKRRHIGEVRYLGAVFRLALRTLWTCYISSQSRVCFASISQPPTCRRTAMQHAAIKHHQHHQAHHGARTGPVSGTGSNGVRMGMRCVGRSRTPPRSGLREKRLKLVSNH
jgi:hypothetical protein